jgi:hypothetical protein
MFLRSGRLFVTLIVFALPVMGGRLAMRFCCVIVVFGCFRMRFLRHFSLHLHPDYRPLQGRLGKRLRRCRVSSQNCPDLERKAADISAWPHADHTIQ